MPIQFSAASRNAQLNAHEAVIGVSPVMRILDGPPPANCAAAQTGTLLAELALPENWALDAAAGTKAMTGTWAGLILATGTASYYRIVALDGTCHEQGWIGTTASDLNGASITLTEGQMFAVTAKTLTAGNA